MYSGLCWLLIIKNPHWVQQIPYFSGNVHNIPYTGNYHPDLYHAFYIASLLSITGQLSNSSLPLGQPIIIMPPSFASDLHLDWHPQTNLLWKRSNTKPLSLFPMFWDCWNSRLRGGNITHGGPMKSFYSLFWRHSKVVFCHTIKFIL